MRIEELKAEIVRVLKKNRVKKAGLFGSVARGESLEDSDIDLLVELPQEASLLDLVGIKLELEELFRKKVDVLTYDAIYPLLRQPILNEEIPLI